MRGDFLGGASTTGGTSALTITSAGGLALPAQAFVADQLVDYSIVEYSDSTLATVVQAESGIGLLSSGNVLTRSSPRVTWNGTTYDNTSPSALSFGTSNVRVYVAPMVAGGHVVIPQRFAPGSGGPDEHINPQNLFIEADFSAGGQIVTSSLCYMTPALFSLGFAVSSVGVAVTTAVSGATLQMALATMAPVNGEPDRVLFGASVSLAATGFVSASIGPLFLPPGWYWMLFQASANNAAIRGSNLVLPGPAGNNSGNRSWRFHSRTRTYGAFAAGDQVVFSGSYGNVNNLAAPYFGLK